MNKLKALVVPEGVGRWLDHQELGKESTIFTVINNLDQLFRINLDNRTGYFIMLNKKELIEVIIGSRDYEVEDKQKYYVDLDTAAYVAKWKDDGQVNIYTDGISGNDKFEFHLTEQEIKNYDERFWPFAVKVEEM